jgi:peptidoglycan/LPS O-acetylase OafA/YrhL
VDSTAALPAPASERIAGLDGLRAFAVVAVIAAHAHVPWLHGGGLGVDAFFVLSGFLITSLLLREAQRFGRISVGRFWGRRLLRLLPAVLLVVAVVDLVALLMPARLGGLAGPTLSSTPGVLFYFSNWLIVATNSGALGAFGPLWSLSVEEQFYLIWPMIVIFALLTRRPLLNLSVVIGAICCAVTIGRFLLFDAENVYSTFSTSFRIDMLLLGCLLAIGFTAGFGGFLRAASRWLLLPAIAYLCVVAMFLPEFNSAGSEHTTYLYYTVGLPLLGLACVALIAYVTTHQRSVLTRSLQRRPFAYLGRISYGMYLWHYPVILVLQVRFHPDPNITFLAAFALTVVTASVSWFALERPLSRRFHARLAATASDAALPRATNVDERPSNDGLPLALPQTN